MSRTETRARHVRHRTFERARKDRSGLRVFLADESTRLTGTETGQTFTAANATDICTVAGHGFTEGDGPFLLSNAGGALPAGLDATTLYWVRVIDVNTFFLLTDRQFAASTVGEVDITDDGTGTQTIARAPTDAALFEWLDQRRVPRHIAAVADIDDL